MSFVTIFQPQHPYRDGRWACTPGRVAPQGLVPGTPRDAAYGRVIIVDACLDIPFAVAMTNQQQYDALLKTASDWVTSTRPKTSGSNDPDYDHILSLLAPNAILRFGHLHFVSTAPHLQHDESPEDFVARLKSMSPAFQTWRIDVADVNVDIKKRSAVVRAVFHMQAKNDPEVIQNEILFWCQMDDGERKIVQSTEFVDPAALQALGPKLKAAKMANGE